MNQPRIEFLEGLMQRTETLRAYASNDKQMEYDEGRSPFVQLCIIVNELLKALLQNQV
jgi:hypothetical protein